MLSFIRNEKFLKGVVSFFFISIFFAFVSCATSPEEIQEEEEFSEAPIVEEEIEQAKLPLVIDSPDYVLGPEDVIQVLVWKDDSLTRTVMIRPDGKISLPLVGEKQAAGLTPGALAIEVKKSLQKYYKEQPEVSVIVTEINSFAFFVLGEVVAPGKYVLKRETTLLQALSLAGGFKEYADTKNILLLRKQGSTEKRIHINYKNLISGKIPEDNLLLKAGDTLIVP